MLPTPRRDRDIGLDLVMHSLEGGDPTWPPDSGSATEPRDFNRKFNSSFGMT